MRLCSEVTVSGEANYFIAACLIQLACSTQEGPPHTQSVIVGPQEMQIKPWGCITQRKSQRASWRKWHTFTALNNTLRKNEEA